jgi:TolA-binding protein
MKKYFRFLAISVLLLLVVVDPEFARSSGDSLKARSIEDELKLQAGDEYGNELKSLKTEMLVMRSEKRALDQLEKLKVRYKGTRMEPEILFRLGEIYMRRARSDRFFEVHRDSNQIARFSPDLVKSASEKAQIRMAIKIYSDLEKRFPRFRSRDVVVFNAAYAYQQVGDEIAAEKHFSRLLIQHPSSSLVPDSLLALGEIQFSRRQFASALQFFLKIKEFPSARVFPYGLYKAAWSKYNLQDGEGALKLLEEVVATGHERSKEGADSSKLDLRKEALADMALFYSETRKSDEAVVYFVAQARNLDPAPYLLRLVEIYKRHAKYLEVESVLRELIHRIPQTSLIADVYEELIWNADRQMKRESAVQHLMTLDQKCGDLEPKLSCETKVRDISKKLGAKLHAAWKKENQAATADQALKVYEIYFDKSKLAGYEGAQVRFAYADLLFSRNRFREASQNYSLVFDDSSSLQKNKTDFDLVKMNPKLAVDAAYASAVALEKAVGESKWSDQDESQFEKLSDRYLRLDPRGSYAVDIRFKRAFIAYEKEKFTVALNGFRELGWTRENFDHPKIIKAQDLYLDILNIRKDFRGLKEAAQQLLTLAESISSSSVKDTAKPLEKSRIESLFRIRREAWFAEIGELEVQASKTSEHMRAVGLYRSFATDNVGSDLAPKAWWNASQILFRLGQVAEAASMCAQMPKKFPGASQTRECLIQAAQTYESIAQLDLASQVAGLLADVDKQKSSVWQALATDFLALTGNRDLKEQAFRNLIKAADENAGKPQRQAEILEKALQIAKEMGNDKSMSIARTKIEAIGVEPQVSLFLLEEAEAAYRAGDSARAFSLAKRVVGKESQLSTPRSLPAKARMLQARVLEDEYRQQSVKARVERIGIVLAIKTEKLEKVQQAYQSAAKMAATNTGDPAIAIEAQAKLADLYIDYARTVRSMKSMKMPQDVPSSDQMAFAKEIEQIAIPMEEKGIEATAQVIDAAKRARRLDGMAGRLQMQLDKLNMKKEVSEWVEPSPLPNVFPGFEWTVLGFEFEGSRP